MATCSPSTAVDHALHHECCLHEHGHQQYAVTGKQLMAVWDSLCQLLRARQISVEDVSNKVWVHVEHCLCFFAPVSRCNSDVLIMVCKAPVHAHGLQACEILCMNFSCSH